MTSPHASSSPKRRESPKSPKGRESPHNLVLDTWIEELCSGKQRVDRLSLAVLGDVEGASFHHVARVGGDAERFVDRRVDVLQPDRVLDWQHRMGVRRPAIGEAALEAAAEEQQAVTTAEVAVEPVLLFAVDDQAVA